MATIIRPRAVLMVSEVGHNVDEHQLMTANTCCIKTGGCFPETYFEMPVLDLVKSTLSQI